MFKLYPRSCLVDSIFRPRRDLQSQALATPLKASNSSYRQKTEALWELILRMVFIFPQDAGNRENSGGYREV